MKLEVWADLVCAWAYIGKRRMERALETWDGETVEVVWRPFRVDPAAPSPGEPAEPGLDMSGADDEPRRSGSEHEVADERALVAWTAESEGLGADFGARLRTDSGEAHRLVQLALLDGGPRLQNAVVEELLHAHFRIGADLSDPSVLATSAERAGFPAGGSLLSGPAGKVETREAQLRGKALGVDGSPTFMLNGRSLSGAQPPEALTEFLRSPPKPESTPPETERLRHADALLSRRDPLGALELLAPLLRDFGDDPNVALVAARAYYGSAQLGRARRTLETMVARNPGDFFARELLGRTLWRLGDSGAAAQLKLASPDE